MNSTDNPDDLNEKIAQRFNNALQIQEEMSPEVQTEVNNLLENVADSLPDDFKIQVTDTFVDSVKKAMEGKVLTFDEQIEESCQEKIIDAFVMTNNEQGKNIKMNVLVAKANYGSYLYWKVVCDSPCTGPFDVHPFRKICRKKDFNNLLDIGEVIADNELMRKMFEFLIKPDDELELLVGHTSPTDYRASIIQAINFFWD
jgi:hypothetical protein